jgi:hypothetical protein
MKHALLSFTAQSIRLTHFLSPQKKVHYRSLKTTGTTHVPLSFSHMFLSVSNLKNVPPHYVNIMLDIHHHLRHLHVFTVSGSGSMPFSRVLIMVLILILMATAGIEPGTS